MNDAHYDTEETGFTAHESAVIDPGSEIGAGTAIWHFTHIRPGSRIGRGCIIGQNCCIGPDVSVGDGCRIQNNISIYHGVTLEDHVFCGPSAVFTNVLNPRAHLKKMDEARPTLVKQGATVGAGAVVVCGNTIGRFALIGAGAVVTHDVSDHALMLGVPARRAGWVCECGETLSEELVCPKCSLQYTRAENGLNKKG